jgi:hypothetical protein
VDYIAQSEGMMRDFGRAAIVVAAFMASGTLAFADGSMQPGKWQITTEGSSLMGDQKVPLPKNQMESCVTPDQAKQASNIAQQPTQDGCKSEVLLKNSNETKTRTTCPTSTTTVDFTVSSDAYTAITHMETKQGDMPVVTDMTAIGKRIGDCSQ